MLSVSGYWSPSLNHLVMVYSTIQYSTVQYSTAPNVSWEQGGGAREPEQGADRGTQVAQGTVHRCVTVSVKMDQQSTWCLNFYRKWEQNNVDRKSKSDLSKHCNTRPLLSLQQWWTQWPQWAAGQWPVSSRDILLAVWLAEYNDHGGDAAFNTLYVVTKYILPFGFEILYLMC